MSRKSKPTTSTEELRITIAAAPSVSLDMQHELRLVKCGLLYADRVDLCSPAASMLFAVHGLKDLKIAQQIEFIAAIGPVLRPENGNGFAIMGEMYKKMARGKNLPKEVLLNRAQIEGKVRSAWESLSADVEKILEASGVEELRRLINAGLLSVRMLGQSGDTDAMVREYVQEVLTAVGSRTTYPLLDAQTGDLLAAMLREGQAELSDRQQERGRHPALAANLFERLPAFDRASVDELLDIRKELQAPLVRFRRALMTYAAQMQAGPWGEDFAAEAEDLFHREVLPVLLEIEELIEGNSVLKQLAGASYEHPLAPAEGSAAGLLIAHLSSLPHVLATALGLGVGGVAIAGQALTSWRDKGQAAERNDLYFYYRLRERLAA